MDSDPSPSHSRNDIGAERFYALIHRSEARHHDVDADLLVVAQTIGEQLRCSNRPRPKRIDHAVPRSGTALGFVGEALGVWSRSVGESAKLIPHSGRDYGPGTSRLRHDHARRPNCDTAIEGSAQGTSGAVWAEPQDSCQVA